MISINQFTALLQSLAGAHEQIKTFGEGDVWEIGASKAVQYPLMWASLQPSSTGPKLLNMKFSLLFADLVFADKSNEQEVLSDTQQIALDILAQLNSPDYSDDFILDPNAQLTPFTEHFDDDVAGWKVDINIKVNYLADRCAVPSTLLPSPLTAGCAPALVMNSDGTFTATFNSGSTHTLADIQFTDSDGTETNVPAQKNIVAKTLDQLVAEDNVSLVYDALTAASKLDGLIQILENADLNSLTTAQLDYIVTLLSTAQVQLLSSTQVGELNATEIAEIVAFAIQYLTNSQLSHLTTAQLDYIVSLLVTEQVQLLSLSQVQMLSNTQVQELSSAQIAALNATQVQALTNSQIANLSSTQVQVLTNTQIGYLNATQVQELVNTQLANLSTGQLQYILGSLMGNQFLQDNLTISQRNSVNEIYPLQTGQTTSYATGDDGDLKHGRLADFFTLKTNNIFGNTNRFTDENGNQTYSSHYVIDHATGLGWCTTLQGTATWATAVAASISLTVGSNTYTDFKLPNVNEMLSVFDFGLNNLYMNYSPFNQTTQNTLFTSTTLLVATTNAFRVINGASTNLVSSVAKTTSQFYYLVRKHF